MKIIIALLLLAAFASSLHAESVPIKMDIDASVHYLIYFDGTKITITISSAPIPNPISLAPIPNKRRGK